MSIMDESSRAGEKLLGEPRAAEMNPVTDCHA
jgi:hypothetical protein